MYYLELIQRFWEFNKIEKLNPTEVSLYLYLLKIGYDHNRYDFKITDIEVGNDLGLSRVTIKASKDKLKAYGLIEFQTSKGMPCNYRLQLNYFFDYKSSKVKQELGKDIETFETSKISEIIPQTEIQNITDIDVPTLSEFIDYAKSLTIYETGLDSSITEKYESWIKNGWKNASGRSISNWKATLKSALPYLSNSKDNNNFLREIPNIKHPDI